jgi:hypothetical protein
MSEGQRFGYERKDVSLRLIGWFTLGLFLFLVISLVSMRWLFQVLYNHQLSQEQPRSPMIETASTPPAPRLETYEGEVLAEIAAYELPLRYGYGWVDQPRGRARVPLQRGIELYLQEHRKEKYQ